MSRSPGTRQLEEFEKFLEQYYRENCNLLIRRFSSMGDVSEIRGAIHEVLAGVFERYMRGGPAPDNLGGFVHVAVRRKLIDLIREEAGKVPIEEEQLEWVVAFGMPKRARASGGSDRYAMAIQASVKE